jgi:predicted oxidoreductase
MVSKVLLRENGLSLSALVAGMWRLPEQDLLNTSKLRAFVEGCLSLGISTFDHANIYGRYTCEEAFGKVLKEAPQLKDKIELISKAGIKPFFAPFPDQRLSYYDFSSAHLITEAEKSLSLLNVDALDLWMLHRPDYLMHPEETAKAISHLLETGKIKHWAYSNFNQHQAEMIQAYVGVPAQTHQFEFSLLHTNPLEEGLFEQAFMQKWKPMIWSPLGGGSLFVGKETQVLRIREVLTRLAEEHKVGIETIALAWVLRHPSAPVPVLGTGKLSRMAEYAKAIEVQLSRQDWYELLKATRGEDIP